MRSSYAKLFIIVSFLFLLSFSRKAPTYTKYQLKLVKWKQNQITYTQGKPQVKVCPDTNVMKAKYQCFIYDANEVKLATGKTVEQLYGTTVRSMCAKVSTSNRKVDPNLPMPVDGFNNILYRCEIRAPN